MGGGVRTNGCRLVSSVGKRQRAFPAGGRHPTHERCDKVGKRRGDTLECGWSRWYGIAIVIGGQRWITDST